MENFPAKGGCLLVSNHLSYADPVFIGAAFLGKLDILHIQAGRFANHAVFLFRLTKTLTVSSGKVSGECSCISQKP